ncbi:MAG: hypothetical protein WCK14_11635 [Actinomycetota bacterium]
MSKRDVEALLARFDSDPIGALSAALRKVLDSPNAQWPELVAAAAFSDARSAALLLGEQRCLDQLARELNELRSLEHL